MAQQPQNKPRATEKNKLSIFGIALIAFGVIFLIQQIFKVNILSHLPWDYIWPILAILLGIHMIYRKSK